MWVCESCGESFVEPKRIPLYREHFDGCPYCESLMITQNAMQCKYCECWVKEDDMYVVAGLCKDCVTDILCERHDLLMAYAMEDLDAFSEFASEKLDAEKRLVEGNKNAPQGSLVRA